MMKKQVLVLFALLAFAVTALASAPKSRFAEFGGSRVHYVDAGKGSKALILIHGWTCSADFWDASIGAFPEYRVIAVDLPGHGRSDAPKTDYTMEYFARAVEAVMRDAKVKKAVFAGHSMGTPVMRQFYRIYPKKTLGLVIVDGTIRPGTKEEMEAFAAPFRDNYAEHSLGFVEGFLPSIKDERLREKVRSTMTSVPAHVGQSAMLGMFDFKIWTNDKIDVPVLAILAESPWWKPDTEEFYRSVAPDLEFHMWKDVSHFLMMERPEEFNREVREFIAEKKLL